MVNSMIDVAVPSSSRRARLRGLPEAPTWILALVIYGGWGLLTWFDHALPWWLVLPLGSWLIAWHMSLQHEVIHGHPTRSARINAALGFTPLSLWLPYERYRQSHTTHHREEWLTDPVEDPESRYVTPAHWAARGPLTRTLLRVDNTLAGRLTIGPALAIAGFLRGEAVLLARGDREAWTIWLTHGAAAGAVAAWVILVCGIPLWAYALLYVYPGFALALVRSFAEHRAAGDSDHRTAIVERAPLFGLLFLHNNLHVVHHLRPDLPWYAIPAYYRANRSALIARNGGLVYRGYGEVARRYLFTPHHQPPHPFTH